MSLRFIDRAEEELEQNTIKAVFISWDYNTNITDHNEKIKLDYQVRKIAMTIQEKILLTIPIPEDFRCTQPQTGKRGQAISSVKAAKSGPPEKA